MLAQEADSKVYNIVHLIYHARRYEGSSKDYEFSRRTMEEHWQSGYSDMERTLRHPEVLQRRPLVLDPQRPGRAGHLELVVQQLVHRRIQGEIDLGRDRN